MKIEIKDNIVTNDGEPIGTIEGGTCTLTAAVPPVVKGAINREFGDKLTFIIEGGDEEEPEPPKRVILTPPAQHPAMGDKDPAYVSWYREHHSPEDFKAKYHAGRKLPTIEDFRSGEQQMRGKLRDEKTDKGE